MFRTVSVFIQVHRKYSLWVDDFNNDYHSKAL